MVRLTSEISKHFTNTGNIEKGYLTVCNFKDIGFKKCHYEVLATLF